MDKINVVFVQYGNSDEIKKQISSLPTDIVDVYIGINDGINHDYKNAKFIDLKENIGYLPAFQRVIRNWGLSGITILSNSDVKFSQDFFSRIIEYHWDNNIRVLAPRIKTSSHREQNPNLVSRNSKLKMLAYKLLYSSVLGNLYLMLSDLKLELAQKSPIDLSKRIIYSAHGACVIFKEANDFIGLEEYGGFLQNEEYWIAEKFKGQILFDPDLSLVHMAHSTIGLANYSKRRGFMKNSMSYILKEFY